MKKLLALSIAALTLAFAVPLGFGQGAIDTGMNFYVSKHYSSRDMSWLHCCWGVGATLGPLIASIFLFVLGYFLWGIVQRLHKEEWFRRGFAPLSFLGRHSLLIYLLHQPVLMGACVLFFDVLKLSLPINK